MKLSYLINNPKMFNGETDGLAAKKYFNESVANALRGNIGIVNFGL